MLNYFKKSSIKNIHEFKSSLSNAYLLLLYFYYRKFIILNQQEIKLKEFNSFFKNYNNSTRSPVNISKISFNIILKYLFTIQQILFLSTNLISKHNERIICSNQY